MLTLSGWIVVATLNGKHMFDSKELYKTAGECYVALHWPKSQTDRREYNCFYIQGKQANLEVVEQ